MAYGYGYRYGYGEPGASSSPPAAAATTTPIMLEWGQSHTVARTVAVSTTSLSSHFIPNGGGHLAWNTNPDGDGVGTVNDGMDNAGNISSRARAQTNFSSAVAWSDVNAHGMEENGPGTVAGYNAVVPVDWAGTFSAGLGSTEYIGTNTGLFRGSTIFSALAQGYRVLRAAAVTAGHTPRGFLRYNQGHADASAARSKAHYRAVLNNVWRDWQILNAVERVTDYESRVLIDPLSDSRDLPGNTWYQIQDAQIEMWQENPDKFVMLPPRNPLLSDALGIHSTSPDRRHRNEMAGRSFAAMAGGGLPPAVPMVTTATRSGDDVILTVDRDVSERPGYTDPQLSFVNGEFLKGFGIFENGDELTGTPVALTSVTFESARQIRIAMATSPAGSLRWSYARQPRDASLRTPEDGMPRGAMTAGVWFQGALSSSDIYIDAIPQGGAVT